MRYYAYLIIMGVMLMLPTISQAAKNDNQMTKQVKDKNAYDFEFKTLEDYKPLPLSNFKGNVILIVNTASKCGFTTQYEDLEALYEKYKSRGLTIIAVPSNDFGHQEPGDEREIAEFSNSIYDITFPMTSKERVSGKHAHPFYLWAKEELGVSAAPKWNFHKYLINRQGELINYFYSTTPPSACKVRKAIERALKEPVL